MKPQKSTARRLRHRRNYAEGVLPEDRSFYFRGPDRKLNLRAHNLQLFVQIAEGIDDQTWLHHLRQGDYSQWLRGAIRDNELADQIEEVEKACGSDAESSRRRIGNPPCHPTIVEMARISSSIICIEIEPVFLGVRTGFGAGRGYSDFPHTQI